MDFVFLLDIKIHKNLITPTNIYNFAAINNATFHIHEAVSIRKLRDV